MKEHDLANSAKSRVFDPFAGLDLSRHLDLSKHDFDSSAGGLRQVLNQEFDVCVVGSGPGGSTVAAECAQMGLSTVLVESGPFLRAHEFSQEEANAAKLYKGSMAQTTLDGAITVLQGQVVGGSATVNWTSSFRAPQQTLQHWHEKLNFPKSFLSRLEAIFPKVEKELSVGTWETPNTNNNLLQLGCEELGWKVDAIPRNVRGCWDIGLCGMGCPTNAKRTSLTVMIPRFMQSAQSYLLSNAHADRLEWKKNQVTGIWVGPPRLDHARSENLSRKPASALIRARLFVLAAGAIGTPALLMRSKVPDPYSRLGKRTFLHPVVSVFSKMPQEVQPYAGAPQSVYSDQFLWPEPDQEEHSPGFKIEALPLFPMFAAGLASLASGESRRLLEDLKHTHASLALQRDGFHPLSQGGTVREQQTGGGSVRYGLDYPLTTYHYRGFQHALERLGEAHFAAGAREVMPLHADASWARTFAEYREQLGRLSPRSFSMRVGSAHVMGGSAMSHEEREGVVDLSGRHHQMKNLFVADGSLFPTSLGVNPQVTIFALAHLIAQDLKIVI